MEKQGKWSDLWNISFPDVLYPSNADEMEHNLRHDPKHRIKGLTSKELREAIHSLVNSGKHDARSPSLKQFRREIFINRKRKKNPRFGMEDKYDFKLEQELKETLKTIKDPAKRWDFCCDKTGHGTMGNTMCENLIQFARKLPGGVEPATFDYTKVLEEKKWCEACDGYHDADQFNAFGHCKIQMQKKLNERRKSE